MIVLGIDPGTVRAGYGVIRREGRTCTLVRHGIFEVGSGATHAGRLRALAAQCEALLAEVGPDRVGVERLYFSKNKKTALQIAEARGVIVAAVAARDLPLFEFTPQEVKHAVTGSGNAPKAAVSKMVGVFLRFDTRGLLDDITDALAVALAAAEARV